MSTEISLGFKIYEIAKILHAAIFVNGTLINVETWPNCTEVRLKNFERIEQTFMRNILNAHSKTPIEALYLEMGIIPLRFQLMKRRILYLQKILSRSDNEITKQIVLEQKKRSIDGDFYDQVKNDMVILRITDEQLLESKEKLKEVARRKMNEAAFTYLIDKAKTHSKVNDSLYTNCEGAKYLKHTRFTPDLVSVLFRFRRRTYLVKNNFRNNYRNTNIACPLCEVNEDTQEHIFKCYKLRKGYSGKLNCCYEDIFSGDCDTLLKVATALRELTQIREKLLSLQENLEPAD